MIIVFRINKAGMEKMKKNNKGKLNNKKQVLIIIAVISIMVFICIVLQAYIEGYFGGKKKSVKTQTQNTINREKDGSKADSNDNKSSKTKNTKTVKKNNTAKNKCTPSFFCSFTSSCSFGLFINTSTKNTSVVKKYISVLFVPKEINVPTNVNKYIKPIGLRLLNIDAKKLIANGLILSIRL